MAQRVEIPEALLDLVYEAASEPALWLLVVERIAQLTDSASGMLLVQTMNNRLVFDHISGLAEEGAQAYRLRHVGNPFTYYLADKPIGTVVASEAMMRLPQLRASQFYDEVLRPQRLDYSAFNIVVGQGSTKGGICVNRGPRQGPYGARELGLIERITPHLRRSLQLAMRFDGCRMLRDAQLAALEQLAVGVVLLDEEGDVLLANGSARQFCGNDGPLALSRNGVRHKMPSHSRRIEALVQRARQGTPMATIGVPCGDRIAPLLLVACAVRRQEAERFIYGHSRRPSALLFIIDVANPRGIDQDWLIDAFGMTPAEAKVAAISVGGANSTQAASLLGISPNTVKTHLGRIFAKTGTDGQARLAGLLASLTLFDTQPR